MVDSKENDKFDLGVKGLLTPCDITSEWNMKVTRMKEMISYNLLIVRQILFTSTLGNE